MKILIVGASQTAKTPLAEKVAASLHCKRISASEWFRANFPVTALKNRNEFVAAITEFSLAALKDDPNLNVRYLQSKYDLSDNCIIEGIRNPYDFVHLFDWRCDLAIFMDCKESTVSRSILELHGIPAIRAYVDYLLACGLTSPSQIFYFDLERFSDLDQQAVTYTQGLLDNLITKSFTIHAHTKKIRCAVREEYLYNMDPTKIGRYVDGHIFVISSYVGSVPTFTVLLDDGSVFSYLPPQAIIDPLILSDVDQLASRDLSNFNCDSGQITAHEFEALRGPVVAYFKHSDRWITGTYVLTVDWYQSNTQAHLISLSNGQFAFVPQHKLKFGPYAEKHLPDFKKMRSEWRSSEGLSNSEDTASAGKTEMPHPVVEAAERHRDEYNKPYYDRNVSTTEERLLRAVDAHRKVKP